MKCLVDAALNSFKRKLRTIHERFQQIIVTPLCMQLKTKTTGMVVSLDEGNNILLASLCRLRNQHFMCFNSRMITMHNPICHRAFVLVQMLFVTGEDDGLMPQLIFHRRLRKRTIRLHPISKWREKSCLITVRLSK